ncbi:MAG: DUF416 family protein [Halomonadaceae bacterium]|nr:MAG: DUF416 family protein [Halomonadaceae bacterium]
MNLKQFQKALGQLGSWRQFAFLLALAERGFANFALFAELTRPADADRFRQTLDQGWMMLLQPERQSDVFRLLTRLETVRPDPVEHDFYGTGPALEAYLLLEQALLCHVNAERPRAEEGAAIAMGTVVTFVEFTEGEGLDENALIKLLDNHELVKIEQTFQKALISELQVTRKPGERFVAHLRSLAKNEGVSNLGLEVPERWQ